MKVLCSKCGYPNDLKKVSFKEPTRRFTCGRCGQVTVLETGTIGVPEAIRQRETATVRRRFGIRRPVPGRRDTRGPEPDVPASGEDLFPLSREPSGEGRGEAEYPVKVPKKFRMFAVFMALVIVSVALSTLGTLYYRTKATEAVNTAKTYVMENPEVARVAGKPVKIELTQMQFIRDGQKIERARFAMKVTGADRTITVVTYLKKNGGWAVTSIRHLDSSGMERSLDRADAPRDRERRHAVVAARPVLGAFIKDLFPPSRECR
ncbi:MAG: hypothetical protein M0Q23_08560 [Syntrophales bacterium]|jgi:ribosomal protein S27E|nr:hypothetical protein [Syntrophales bacterium]MCK9528673.1 hypothetical protein [Syntrophales bacterium]MDX9922021.1 hypothetical protein [Syntrophales bacterium]